MEQRPIVYETDKVVVRCGTDTEKNEVRVVIHRKNEAGEECLPRGYMLGLNILIYKI